MKTFLLTLSLLSTGVFAQEKSETPHDGQMYALAKENLKTFAREVSKSADSELGKSQLVVKWLAEHFEWKATDYQKRTVKEIIDRGGGNCNELAMVAVECFKVLNIPMRKVREVNVHREDSSRGVRAKELVREKGYSYSVFGRHHNDHVWLEIHDSRTNEWYPADPSIGLVGTKEWLESRAGFGEKIQPQSNI